MKYCYSNLGANDAKGLLRFEHCFYSPAGGRL